LKKTFRIPVRGLPGLHLDSSNTVGGLDAQGRVISPNTPGHCAGDSCPDCRRLLPGPSRAAGTGRVHSICTRVAAGSACAAGISRRARLYACSWNGTGPCSVTDATGNRWCGGRRPARPICAAGAPGRAGQREARRSAGASARAPATAVVPGPAARTAGASAASCEGGQGGPTHGVRW